jgi:HlyD family secretion protein
MRTSISQQQAVVSNSAAQLPGLKATLDQAQKTYDREKQLLTDKVVSQSEFDQAESALRTAEANYNAAKQSIIGNQAGAVSASANLAIAAKNLYRATVYSPIDGVISLLSVKKGERVIGNNMMAGTEMMRVADMNKIEAIVDVGENDIPKVHLGDSANIEVDAYNNRKFKGIVTQIASSVATTATTTTANDVTNYKVHIRLSADSYKDLIDPKRPKSFPFRPGMSASADIQTNTHPNVLSVAINAVTTREKNSDIVAKTVKKDDNNSDDNPDNTSKTNSSADLDEVVFILKPDATVKKVKVKTSIQDINNIEITDGLKEGDEVITGPYSTVSKVLKEGTKVHVVPKEKLFEIKKD